MKKPYSIFAIVLSYFITVSCASSLMSQEELRIDNQTVAVVESPWKLADVDTKSDFRGLHVYSADDVWVSGSNGTIANTFDGGENWHVHQVPGAEELDFRDIHAIDDGTIIAITSGTPARVYRSTSGGSNWSLCYENTDERVFLDSVAFLDASGTNMISIDGKKVFIGLGSHLEGQASQTSRILFTVDSARTWKKTAVPIARSPSAGIFSICFANKKNGVAVGGDYKRPDDSSSNFSVTNDGGQTWSTPALREPPTGFRSCVSVWLKYGREINMIAVGPNGTDRSTDLGQKWHRISNEGFHSVTKGRIAKWQGIVNARIEPASPASLSEPK